MTFQSTAVKQINDFDLLRIRLNNGGDILTLASIIVGFQFVLSHVPFFEPCDSLEYPLSFGNKLTTQSAKYINAVSHSWRWDGLSTAGAVSADDDDEMYSFLSRESTESSIYNDQLAVTA